MASVAKFKLSDTHRLLSHCNRTQEKLGAHIDAGRTSLNFNLASRQSPEKSDYQFTKDRLHQDDVRMLNRKDVNAVCSWAVTFPKDLCHEAVGTNGESYFTPNDQDECRDFFQHTFDFLANRHGLENVVSAYVHMDENMPHMHFIFTPIVKDDKRGGLKVSAKEALEGCYGAPFQISLQDYVSEKMGIPLNIVKKENVDYERNVKQLKKQTLNKQCSELSRRIRIAQEELDRKKRAIRALETAIDTPVDVRVTSSNGYAVMKDTEWEKVQAQLKSLKALRSERRLVWKELDALEKENDTKKNQSVLDENERLRQQVDSLARENRAIKLEVMDLREFMEDTFVHGRSVMDLYMDVNADLSK